MRRGPGEWSWGIGGALRYFSTGRAGRAKSLVLEVILTEVKLGGVEPLRLPWHLEDNGSLKEMFAD